MNKVKLRVPAGSLSSLRAAVKAGADGVYAALSTASNIRSYPGLNFSPEELAEGVKFAHRRGREVYVAVNANPQVAELDSCFEAVRQASQLEVDAVILSDIAVLEYARQNFPELSIQLSVQASASNAPAIRFFEQRFGIKGVVLPRVLTFEEIREIREATTLELEAFVFGILCINFEGSCRLSSYLTGLPNSTKGLCSPPSHLQLQEEKGTLKMRLAGRLLNQFEPGETATYPTPCKGRYLNLFLNETSYPFQTPASLNILPLLPKLIQSGVDALKIEGRQRSHIYVRDVTRVFREAIDAYYQDPARFKVKSAWEKKLLEYAEGKNFIQACFQEK